ncbi:hypothetical protein FS842_006569 [Serendipita sp. 407]|nr:hypothetical protein FS842_006569 [Serendipita sp. 407]
MWCWIRTEYSVERYALHYGWQWLSAFVSLILYTLLFFRLRGNIQVDGWHFHFQHRPNFTILPVAKLLPTTGPGIRRLSSTSSRHMVPMVDLQVQKIARNMMLYPIAYIFLLLPQSLVRFLDSAAHKKIPDSIKLLAATLLWLNGLVDAILFTLTRSSVTADPSFLPHSLRTFFGLSSEDESKESVRQVTYHHSTQQISIPSMGQTYGISIEANIERKSEKWPSSRVTYSHGCQRPVGLHGAVTSLNHHRRDSSNLTVYSNYDRRKFSVEDECGHTFYASPMKANEKPQVGEEEGEFIQYLQPQLQPPRPVAGAPAHRYSLGCGHGDLQGYFYDDDPVISFSVIPHPYNGQTTMH